MFSSPRPGHSQGFSFFYHEVIIFVLLEVVVHVAGVRQAQINVWRITDNVPRCLSHRLRSLPCSPPAHRLTTGYPRPLSLRRFPRMHRTLRRTSLPSTAPAGHLTKTINAYVCWPALLASGMGELFLRGNCAPEGVCLGPRSRRNHTHSLFTRFIRREAHAVVV